MTLEVSENASSLKPILFLLSTLTILYVLLIASACLPWSGRFWLLNLRGYAGTGKFVKQGYAFTQG
jgi:hypothetical protein